MKYEAGQTLLEQDMNASDVDALTLASPGMSIKHRLIMFKVTALHLISIDRLVHLLPFVVHIIRRLRHSWQEECITISAMPLVELQGMKACIIVAMGMLCRGAGVYQGLD